MEQPNAEPEDTRDPYTRAVDELLDAHARQRYEMTLQQVSERLRLAQEHDDPATVTVCRRALGFLTYDFRTFGTTPIFAMAGSTPTPVSEEAMA